MAESQGQGRAIAIVAWVLLTSLAFLLLHWPQPSPFEGTVGAVLQRVGTPVEVWLSTADRRLRLAQQPDVLATTHAADAAEADVVVDLGRQYQRMAGFGAALTDSSAWLIQNKLNPIERAALLRELFGPPPGLNFNMLRITIGASDFSLQHYTLDDMPAGETDPGLQHFNIVVPRRNVIPVLQEIRVVQPGVLIIASPWSAPAWMKVSANLISGTLLEAYEADFADYLVHFVNAYQALGIPIFALTVENEPTFEPLTYPGMALSAEARARIIGKHLGPALAGRKPATVILGWDHNWDLPQQPLSVLADPDARRYLAGIAWHCYRGNPAAQSEVHQAFPHKDVYLTECAGGDWPSARNGELLLFARNIVMGGVTHWARGVVYWNLALDENHGPHAGGCDECKGIVTIDSTTGAISRNDEYYAFGHFSRFVMPGAARVKSGNTHAGIHQVAFQNPHDGSVVLVAVNGNTQTSHLTVRQGGLHFEYDLPASSVATFVWPPAAGDPAHDRTAVEPEAPVVRPRPARTVAPQLPTPAVTASVAAPAVTASVPPAAPSVLPSATTVGDGAAVPASVSTTIPAPIPAADSAAAPAVAATVAPAAAQITIPAAASVVAVPGPVPTAVPTPVASSPSPSTSVSTVAPAVPAGAASTVTPAATAPIPSATVAQGAAPVPATSTDE